MIFIASTHTSTSSRSEPPGGVAPKLPGLLIASALIDVTQFATVIGKLIQRHAAVAEQAGTSVAEMKVVFRCRPELAGELRLCGRAQAALRRLGAARAALQDEVFGKRVLITSREDWPISEVVAGYRSQPDAEFSFRQLKDRRVVSFAPMHHWTEHNIHVHLFTCVLALQLTHLMRRAAHQAGLHYSVRELLAQLAGIQESVLIYPSTGGRPKARRMLTETTPDQDELAAIFELERCAPRTEVIGTHKIHIAREQ
ncbi:MAG: hypothetical protein JO272_13150 [Pseudonocardiales bacterium]|nr:hypothetical protein [Pseudonocardiales bacterium]